MTDKRVAEVLFRAENVWFLMFGLCLACQPGGEKEKPRAASDFNAQQFGAYWYRGLAEINTYKLAQFRYGEKRDAEAVLIFVTEDFSRQKQVKLDDPEKAPADAQKVLKLNLTKKFVTGIYPYSMMLSVFTPVYEDLPALKITASCQEWCGQTFTQLNYRNQEYKGRLYSYFEKEADADFNFKARSEDEIWNLIRLNPKLVPQGKLHLIPALLDQRFTHKSLQPYKATITIKPAARPFANFTPDQLRVCRVVYEDYPRELLIYFAAAFPYEIAGWEEIHKPQPGKFEISRAERKAVKMLAYWQMNRLEFETKRQELKLD